MEQFTVWHLHNTVRDTLRATQTIRRDHTVHG